MKNRPASAGAAFDSRAALVTAARHHKSGRLGEAELLLRRILAADPANPNALHALGIISLQMGNAQRAADLISRAVAKDDGNAEFHVNLGIALIDMGRKDDGLACFNRAVSLKPSHALANYNIGLGQLEQGDVSGAVVSFEKAKRRQPNDPDILTNLGLALILQGETGKALHNLRKAAKLAPDNPAAQTNLGNALKEEGKPDEALACYREALTLDPDHADAHYNEGLILDQFGRLNESIVCYRRALSLRPNDTMVLSNLGTALLEQGNIDEALDQFRHALAIDPSFAKFHHNLGAALSEKGLFEDSAAAYRESVALSPDDLIAWKNLGSVTKILDFLKPRDDRGDGMDPSSDLDQIARLTTGHALHLYYLASFIPHEATESFRNAMAALPRMADETIDVGSANADSSKALDLGDNLIALHHFGRSGTGLLHSLIDDHPQISTLPSIFLKGFFNSGVWEMLANGGWRELPERFADQYEVLFDTTSPKPVPGILGENTAFLGKHEGMTNLGEGRDENISLNRQAFCSEARRLMKPLDKVDPGTFFLIVHAAYEKAFGTTLEKSVVFYHLHRCELYTKLNFLRYFPNSRLVMMVREPIQSCESWVRGVFKAGDYDKVAARIRTMLFDIDEVVYQAQECVGVRLEDLKMYPKETLKSLCSWLGVQEAPSLYHMTARGKKWWGDPSSPDYDPGKEMTLFDEKSINRQVGEIFSDRDQLVLRTLFYPFSVRFGYREPNPVEFEKDLEEIRPLFDEMMDFEIAMSKRLKVDHARFKRSAAYNLLRASFTHRWEVLNKFKEYPNMISPLEIATE